MRQRTLTAALALIALVVIGTALLAFAVGCPVNPRRFRACVVGGVDIAWGVHGVALASMALFWVVGGYALLWIVVGAATRERIPVVVGITGAALWVLVTLFVRGIPVLEPLLGFPFAMWVDPNLWVLAGLASPAIVWIMYRVWRAKVAG
ncbi:MAG: hypothetical protein KJ025_21935 [Burkholderiales bacterium]|nr:hypothetical protein [Burkholderiales bacterium]